MRTAKSGIRGTRRSRRAERVPRAAKVDAYRGRVDELLLRYPDITAQRVFEVLKDEGFTGGYTGVKKHVRRVRPPRDPRRVSKRPCTGQARWPRAIGHPTK